MEFSSGNVLGLRSLSTTGEGEEQRKKIKELILSSLTQLIFPPLLSRPPFPHSYFPLSAGLSWAAAGDLSLLTDTITCLKEGFQMHVCGQHDSQGGGIGQVSW
jgi:hypothetical protein